MNIVKITVTCPLFLILYSICVHGQEGGRVQNSNGWGATDTAIPSITEQHLHEDQTSQAGSKQRNTSTRWGIQAISKTPGTEFWPAQTTALGPQAKSGKQSTITTWQPVREPTEANVATPQDADSRNDSMSDDASAKLYRGIRVDRGSYGGGSNGSAKRQLLGTVDPAVSPSTVTNGFSTPFGENEFGQTPVLSPPNFSSGRERAWGEQAGKIEARPSSGNHARKETHGSHPTSQRTEFGTLTDDQRGKRE